MSNAVCIGAPRVRSVWIPVCILILAAFPACSSDGPTAPSLDARLVGTWSANEMLLTSQENPMISEDPVTEFGASFTLSIASSGRYEAVFTAFDESDVERGDVTTSGSAITLDPDGSAPASGTWSLTGGVLTIDTESTYDFNRDLTPEPADLHLELVAG